MKSSRVHPKASNSKTDQPNLQDSKPFIKFTLSKVLENEMPIFEDTLSFSKDFNTAAVDLLLLSLFVIVLLSGAYLAFVRVEV